MLARTGMRAPGIKEIHVGYRLTGEGGLGRPIIFRRAKGAGRCCMVLAGVPQCCGKEYPIL
jgi:hypothetical protein